MCVRPILKAARRLAWLESSWFCNELARDWISDQRIRAGSPRAAAYSNSAWVSLTAQYAAGVPQMVVEVASVPK